VLRQWTSDVFGQTRRGGGWGMLWHGSRCVRVLYGVIGPYGRPTHLGGFSFFFF
jgi:hypothetical protein